MDYRITTATIASNAFHNGKRPILYVEGTLDKQFYERHSVTKFTIRTAEEAIRLSESESHFSSNPNRYHNSSKKYIEESVKYYYKNRAIVDKDFDGESSVQQVITSDAHDLETTLMSKHDNWLNTILLPHTRHLDSDEKDRLQSEIDALLKDTYEKAFQIAVMKKSIGEARKYCRGLNITQAGLAVKNHTYRRDHKNRIIPEYETLFPNNGPISLQSAIDIIFDPNENKYNNPQEDTEHKANYSDYCSNQLTRYFGGAGQSWNYDIPRNSTFWDMVNGHDIMCILLYLVNRQPNRISNPRIRQFFCQEFQMLTNLSRPQFNRLEGMLMTECPQDAFAKTRLYQRMHNTGII